MTPRTAPLIAVVDYGMGNRRSVEKALEHVGTRAMVSRDHETLLEADGLIVPGVGAFPLAMRNLRELGLVELLRERAARGTPLLGICLGMQLLFEHSEELGETGGLGVIAGSVTALRAGGLRVPHIGWSEVRFERASRLTAGLPDGGGPFYHVHSFAARPADSEVVVGTAEYGERFASVVAHGSVFGVQFHPEKSSAHGLRMLADFSALCAEQAARAQPEAARA
jgi:imidazole glycerol-phosphate synthase subunit HisH